MRKLLFGVAINDADYTVRVKETVGYVDGKQKQKTVWMCPFYATWSDMLRRCYSESLKSEFPTYRDASVCEEWLRLSTFTAWMESQDWEGMQLDKDLLFPGNKLYGPETCVFVSRQVNMFMIEQQSTKSKLPIGVRQYKDSNRFQARCSNLGKGSVHLGMFDSADLAHKAYWAYKCGLAAELASSQTNQRVANALLRRYSTDRFKE